MHTALCGLSDPPMDHVRESGELSTLQELAKHMSQDAHFTATTTVPTAELCANIHVTLSCVLRLMLEHVPVVSNFVTDLLASAMSWCNI